MTTIDLGDRDTLTVLDSLVKPAGLFVIDAGCGDLSLSRELAARGASVLGIDPDPVQAEKNRQLPTIDNVGFVEAGADQIPVENQSVDAVFFKFSLHHVPANRMDAVFAEMQRVLKPEGYLYIVEPVARGPLFEVMSMFHDETAVLSNAQNVLGTMESRFASVERYQWSETTDYGPWEQFSAFFVGLSFNATYTETQVRAPEVQARYEEIGKPLDYRFAEPVHLTLLKQPSPLTVA